MKQNSVLLTFSYQSFTYLPEHPQLICVKHLQLLYIGYHKRYPLFASCGDDNNITVSHGMVYSDLLQNPLIVPVKKLREVATSLVVEAFVAQQEQYI
jgi:hypothetical protein